MTLKRLRKNVDRLQTLGDRGLGAKVSRVIDKYAEVMHTRDAIFSSCHQTIQHAFFLRMLIFLVNRSAAHERRRRARKKGVAQNAAPAHLVEQQGDVPHRTLGDASSRKITKGRGKPSRRASATPECGQT